ncbi:MAG: hypothetical protein QOD50_1366, partial [Actinomycetota bacterium]|nr:hypothetical protein [Actinomycetota bacterium]
MTFLFTDIEGSTRLWEQHRDAMPVALERHDAILREAAGAAGGVVVKSTGSCSPRSWSAYSMAPRRSATVRETTTWPAFAKGAMRAAMCTVRPPMSPFSRRSISPVWTPARNVTPRVGAALQI